MRQIRIGIVVIAVCSFALVLGPVRGADPTPAQIAQAWAEREKKVKSCRVVWSEVTTYPKGSFYAAPRAKPEDAPTTDLTIPATCKLIIDASKSRHEYQGQRWSTTTHKLESDASIATFNGTKSARTTLQSPLIENQQVVIKKETVSPESGWPHLLPVWMTIRPSIAQKRIPIEQFVATGRKEKINNRLCSEFTQSVPDGRKQVFIDIERDYQVTRYVDSWNDKLHIKVEISYRPDAVLGWVPATWDFVQCNRNGAIELSKRCTVSEFAVNADVPETEFEPVLPVGARVVDVTSGQEMHSAILPSGERGKEIEFVPGNSFPSYEELMAQPPERTWWEQVWLWVVVGTGVLLIAIVVAWRVRRGQSPPQPT
jgi:hypothetical protein